ncbi:MAG TPA: organomercurial lyase [Chloroflexia bacterium]|nr:organomercurial lyase [Chloroflexia bacterium]
MSATPDFAALDFEVRRLIYDELIERGAVPGASQLAKVLGRTIGEVRDALKRMKEAHTLVLQEGDEEILMAMPFSAVPTPFLVKIGESAWWGNCIWDAIGIAAMVRKDAIITTSCGDCNDAMEVRIEDNSVRVTGGEGIVHFSVPAARWWDNIKFT